MENVTTILSRKQSHFNRISPQISVSDALGRMTCQHADYLIVMDDDENFLGLLTEHDITRTIFNNQPISSTRVTSIMNNRWPVADAGYSVEDCMRMMQRYNVRYLPVFDNLNFLGVISTEDILEEAVSHRFGIFDEEAKAVPVNYSY